MANADGVRGSDVAIVGAGVIGSAIAWRIAQRGLSVTLIDPDPGRGASWVAAGLLAPVSEVHYGEEAVLTLNIVSARLYPGFVAELEDETSISTGYRRCGMVIVARDADDNTALDELFGYQRELGLDVERLSGGGCRALEPALAPSIRGGILAAGDHQIDPRALGRALMDACARRGVRRVTGSARAISVEGGRAIGVMVDDGTRVPCGAVVVAAGARSFEIDGIPDEARPPLRPVKGQLLHLKGPTLLERNVRSLDVYVLPRSDGRVVVGATVEERGFDTTVTAEGIYTMLRDAFEVVPGVLELELVETIAGLRPATPDNAPIIGESAVEGVFYATGHFRNGILLTPVTADAVADLVTGAPAPAVAPFSPLRFQRVSEAVT